MAIDVVLVGGSALHRAGLRQWLDPSHFTVVAERRSFGGVLNLMNEGASPRLVIADVGRLSDKDVADLRRMRDIAPDCRITVLSDDPNLKDLARVIRAGADGYLVGDLSREAFSLSLLAIMNGEKILPGAFVNVLTSDRDLTGMKPPKDRPNLTDRERQILRCLSVGHSNKRIARELNITEGTVKVHLKTFMKKISAVNRTQVALWAESHGIGQDPGPLKARHSSIPSERQPSLSPPSADHVRSRSIGDDPKTGRRAAVETR